MNLNITLYVYFYIKNIVIYTIHFIMCGWGIDESVMTEILGTQWSLDESPNDQDLSKREILMESFYK